MKKIELKHILIFALIIFSFFAFQIFYTGHVGHFDTASKKYLFFFKDSIVSKVDTSENFSWISDQDILTHFIYYDDLKNKKDYYEPNDTSYNNYYFIIWEFKSLKEYEIDNVFINEHSVIGKSEFELGQTLDSKSFCPISIKYLYNIDGMILNLSDKSKVIKRLVGKNYKGFYGLIDKMSICNKRGEPQIYFNFAKSQHPTVLLLYKAHSSFYLIMINSSKKIDESIINILNLE